MALYLTLIELGWLLAAGSGMLWLRENPGRRMRDSPKPSWRSSTLLIAAVGAGAYGGSGLQTRYPTGLVGRSRGVRAAVSHRVSRADTHPTLATTTRRTSTRRPRQFRRNLTDRVAGRMSSRNLCFYDPV